MTCVESLLYVAGAIESVGSDVLTGSSLLVKLELGLELGLRNTADTLKKTMLIGREGFGFHPCSRCRGAKTSVFVWALSLPSLVVYMFVPLHSWNSRLLPNLCSRRRKPLGVDIVCNSLY
uniref:Uncharacterized protein n=1 Tax=Odontella aurita TaxID=265563 RepID=A0A7S4JCI3_9STRA|mmetsp:Transcript_43746/g.133103  ORF Transcript_43746/g.133103 Transcript_43746/m.133103 type:complete len:120 (+) Transcript_43746:35-394(+)